MSFDADGRKHTAQIGTERRASAKPYAMGLLAQEARSRHRHNAPSAISPSQRAGTQISGSPSLSQKAERAEMVKMPSAGVRRMTWVRTEAGSAIERMP